MFKYLFLLTFIFFSLTANEPKNEPSIGYKDSLATLESIKHDTIIYGWGERNVYVFLDPLCPHSRKFLSLIATNKLMLSKYRYSIYLYGIARLKSTKSIAAIYESQAPQQTLLEVMLEDAKISELSSGKADQIISEIEEVAKKLHVNKRPFLIVEK